MKRDIKCLPTSACLVPPVEEVFPFAYIVRYLVNNLVIATMVQVHSLLVAGLAASASASTLPQNLREKLYTVELAPGITEVVTIAGKQKLRKVGYSKQRHIERQA